MCCYPIFFFLSGPPTEPHINYNGTLCFSTNSSINAMIEYTLFRDGHPDSMPKELNGSQCINDPFQGVCTEFYVIALAMNEVGNSTQASSKTFLSNDCRGKL